MVFVMDDIHKKRIMKLYDILPDFLQDENHAYLKERGLVKDAVRPLPSVVDNMDML